MFTVRIAINVKVLLIIHFETIYQSYNNTCLLYTSDAADE